MKTWLLDANGILRFLRNDDAVQSPQSKKLLERANAGEVRLLISVLTVAEVFYALRASYKMTRPAAAQVLMRFVLTGVAEVEREDVLLDALQRVVSANVDLGDAVLAVEAVRHGEGVASFDKDFSRFTDVKRYPW
ncbi:PIN domain-containing protein [Geminisphaera colitermitum]|uniref:PIN domain-containing protein n=1 Tax=Geminisphaera colitermitum TaxID=1148786 RepID=UPI00019650F2|nr:PIN domain-containing protein [Geminisphaera colitermitum]